MVRPLGETGRGGKAAGEREGRKLALEDDGIVPEQAVTQDGGIDDERESGGSESPGERTEAPRAAAVGVQSATTLKATCSFT